MIVPDTLYRYVDTNLTEYVVTGAELEDRGEWSDVVIYERLNAVSFEGCLYVALQTVSTTPPTAVVDENWSSLVIISAAGGGVVTAGSDAYARQQAYYTLQTAWVGTALAQYGVDTASQAYNIAASGSNLAWYLYVTSSGSYIHDTNAAVKAHHIDFGAGVDQVDAADVPYVNGSTAYPTVQAALDALLYVAPLLTSFTNNVGTVEIGSTVSTVDLSWAFNKSIVSQTINQGIGSLSGTLRALTDNGTWTTTRTYTLSASDGVTAVNGNTSITFSNRRYWGTSANSTLDNAQILALTNEFSTTRSQTRSITAAGEYIYFAYPAAWGTASFTVNGLLNTAWELTVVSFTNASGYTSNYNVYRSTNLLTGTYTIVVS